jgi:hypothetical protein
VSDGSLLDLPKGNLHEDWQECILELPQGWSGVPLRLCVVSRSRYVGFGTPLSVTWLTAAKSSICAALFWSAFSMAAIVLMTRPLQHFLMRMLGRRDPTMARVLFPVVIVLIGFFSFLGYFHSPGVVSAVLGLLLLFGAWCCRRDCSRLVQSPVRFLRARPAALLWILMSFGFISLLCSQGTVSQTYQANYRFEPASWSTDNQIPILISQEMVRNHSLKGFSIGLWHVSDRTPALNGLLIPYAWLLEHFHSGDNDRCLNSWALHVMAIPLLATLVFPVWEFLRGAGLRGRGRVTAVLLLACSPFVFFNTIYVWPKLLSATLTLSGWCLAAWSCSRRLDWRYGGAVGLAFALAVMCHGGCVFGLAVLGTYLVFFRFLRRPRWLLACAVLGLCILGLWSHWVAKYDPPGNSLTKAAFAGTFGFDEPHKGVLPTILDAYRQETVAGWLRKKVNAPKTWLGVDLTPLAHDGWPHKGNLVRVYQFLCIFPALGLLCMPFALSLFTCRKARPGGGINPLFRPLLLWWLSLTALLFQGLMMWDIHFLHHYSYNTILLFHLVAILTLLRWRVIPQLLVSFGSMLGFVAFWMISPLLESGWINLGALVLSGFLMMALLLNLGSFHGQHTGIRR